jgi:hypothetical protein
VRDAPLRHRCAVALAVTIAGALTSLIAGVTLADASAHGPRGPLAPATTRSVVALCRTPLRHLADGNVAPIQCSPRAVNTLAWDFYAPLGTAVMSVGPSPSWSRVLAAMCADQAARHSTSPEEQRAAQLASIYYGWNWASRLGRTQPHCD